jgi:hypothetical protein
MKFIEAEEFLKQDERIQKVFIDWWQPSLGDLFTTKRVYDEIDVIVDATKNDIWGMNNTFKGNIYSSVDKSLMPFPLLTEGQLKQFIEDKTKCKLNIGNISKIINIYKKELDIPYETNLLHAYWQVALQIAKEEA